MVEVTIGPDAREASGDVLAVPVGEELAWGPAGAWVRETLGDWLDEHLAGEDFTGKLGQTASIPGTDALPYRRIVFVGLGSEPSRAALRRAAGALARATKKSPEVVTTLHTVEVDRATEAVVAGFRLGGYTFDKYRSEKNPPVTERLVLAGGADEREIEVASVISDAVAWARDMVNEPAGGKAPEVLAKAAAERLGAHGVAVTVWDEHEIAEQRLGGLMGVAQGSDNPPRLVIAEWKPEGATRRVAFVGKGIVFDSGGLTIKPAKSMETMKTDMSGAAAVFAAVEAIARLGVPIEVVGIAPLTENMVSGRAQRPGDVLTVRNGKTIEVMNTDAEGRLVLADGLVLACERDPDLVVDIATLTGACAVALGNRIGGVWSPDDDAAAKVLAAGEAADEPLWRMPYEKEYRKGVDSEVADMKNSGPRYGGAIVAALILGEFVDDRPWAHLDIAGPARAEADDGDITKGGTGFGTRTLIALAEAMAEA